ncbi:scavenger receptor cysteine-rich domain-containing protein DMBT1-like isoform X3 [Narcine bancroftii]|uniref:scavenger receptor cysteine-rich domain-containing protein DMBT1-like isoform X3 n=1 Tax=Narcine bancroftii TaxID=1343680 RepID=UPI0038319469
MELPITEQSCTFSSDLPIKLFFMCIQHSQTQWRWIFAQVLLIPRFSGIRSAVNPPSENNTVQTTNNRGLEELVLVGPEAPCIGDLKIKYNGQWSFLCTSQWNSAIGAVVCRQISCVSYDIIVAKRMSPKEAPILLNTFHCKGSENSLSECSSTAMSANPEQCQSGEIVNVYCQVKKNMVLTNGGSRCAGRVEASNFLVNLRTICGRNWDMKEAQVVCTYLGCGDAVSASGNSQFGVGKWPIVHVEIRCNGTEDDPWKCERMILDHHNCSLESEAAGVVCSAHREARLVGGHDRCSGRLEIQRGAIQGTVCGSHLDLSDARVVCRMLKCGNVISVLQGAYFGEGSGFVWQESYECRGDETTLWNCTTRQNNQQNCTHRNDVSVICSGQKGPRLVGGKDDCSGRVEILRGDTWGTVCDTYWDLKDAAVVCNHLNCGAATAASMGAFFGEGNGSIWKDINECRGNEMRLRDCHTASWGHDTCTHKNDVGVICSVDPWQLRLVNGESGCDGRVEVYHGGVWGRVFDTQWNFNNADVVCRQLNCGPAINVYNASRYGIGKGPVIMYNVGCNGCEPYLWNCNFTHSDSFSVDRDVGVLCSRHVRLRLVDGGSHCAGRVEVYYNGAWGTVCDDSWDLRDARFVCEELNCGSALNATVSGLFGQGSGPIWKIDLKSLVNIRGSGEYLARSWGESNCVHKEDAGVICSGHKAIRLVNGSNPCQGRLEVFYNRVWGTVCSDFFDMTNAEVVCSQLHCGSATMVKSNAAFGEGSDPIWLDDVRCRLDDTLLWQCPSLPWGNNNCEHREDVGVICSESKPTKSRADGNRKEELLHSITEQSGLRLVAGFDNCSGRVEVFLDGSWGTVCDDSWDSLDAAVVCRQLNCGDPVSASGHILFPNVNGTIWMDEVKCKGSEFFLWDCQFLAMGHHDCGHKEDVGVICSGNQPHEHPFNYLRAFVYVTPCILAVLLIVVSFYLVKVMMRRTQKDHEKWQRPVTGFPQPMYEEISIRGFGGQQVEGHSSSCVNEDEYCMVSFLSWFDDAGLF